MKSPPATCFGEYRALLEAVRQATLLAGRLQVELAGASQAKADGSPVTVADFAVQALLCYALRALFPADPIIAEERAAVLRTPEGAAALAEITAAVNSTGRQLSPAEICTCIDAGQAEEHSERYWTIDPIDGTLGFVRGDQFAVCIALVVHGCVEFGVLGCPRLPLAAATPGPGLLLVAGRGAGAWEVPLDQSPSESTARRLFVSREADPRAFRFCESVEGSHNWRECAEEVARALGIVQPPIRIDSQAKYALVARGDCEIYFRVPTSPDRRERIWDHAAGVLLVEEAGGRVTDLDGRPFEFNHGVRLAANRGLVCSHGPAHDRVLALLQQVPG